MPGKGHLVATGIVKHFGGIKAVDGMDITVEPATITGLIGPNGAGKSTFFDCLSGATSPDAGRVVLDGRNISGWPLHKTARIGMVRTFQLTRPLARMSVRENLLLTPQQAGQDVVGALLGRRSSGIQERADEVLNFLRLNALADDYAGSLSGGQKKLLDLARALMLDPAILLLDEPMAGVNPSLGRDIMERIQRLRREGRTFLIVEHDMEAVFANCDPIHVMAQGRPLASGDAEEIRNNPIVQEAYLG